MADLSDGPKFSLISIAFYQKCGSLLNRLLNFVIIHIFGIKIKQSNHWQIEFLGRSRCPKSTVITLNRLN